MEIVKRWAPIQENFIQDCISKCVSKAYDSLVSQGLFIHYIDFKISLHNALFNLLDEFEFLNKMGEVDEETLKAVFCAVSEFFSIDVGEILTENRICHIDEDGDVVNSPQKSLFDKDEEQVML